VGATPDDEKVFPAGNLASVFHHQRSRCFIGGTTELGRWVWIDAFDLENVTLRQRGSETTPLSGA
jgi:hypothetical protein